MKRATKTGVLLLVEDHADTREALARLLGRWVTVTSARTVGEADERVGETAHLIGAVIDERLPDGRGVCLARKLRAVDPTLPALVLAEEIDLELVRSVQLIGVELLDKPARRRNLFAFVDRCLARVDPVEHFARRCALSPRETDLVRCVAAGYSFKQLPRALGVKASTVKSYFDRVQRKSGVRYMGDLAREVLRTASGGPSSDDDA